MPRLGQCSEERPELRQRRAAPGTAIAHAAGVEALFGDRALGIERRNDGREVWMLLVTKGIATNGARTLLLALLLVTRSY